MSWPVLELADSVKITPLASYTYESLLTAILRSQGLRVETDDNVTYEAQGMAQSEASSHPSSFSMRLLA